MRFHFLSLLIAALLVTVSGCSPKAPEKHWDSSASFVIDPKMSIGPIFNGMTIKQVREQLGKPTQEKGFLVYSELGLVILPGRGGLAEGIVCHAANKPFFEKSFSGRTPEGIGIDSTRDEIIAAYGEPTTKDTSPSGIEDLYYESIGMRFKISNGKVFQIVVIFNRDRH